MGHLRLLLAAALLLPAACRPVGRETTLTYRCTDGRVVQATYGGREHATLAIEGKSYRLSIARSASGARYVGDRWQWWTKGMHQARLAPLLTGEAVASDPGVACMAP